MRIAVMEEHEVEVVDIAVVEGQEQEEAVVVHDDLEQFVDLIELYK